MAIEKEVFVRTRDGESDGLMYTADDGLRKPGVLFLTDIGGIRPANKAMAQRLADEGYTVFVPNVFYRSGRPPMFESSFRSGDEKSMKRMAELTGPLTVDAITQDVGTYVDFMIAQPSVKQGGVGVVGYCFTGSMALRAAAVRPDQVFAMASFHGGRLFVDGPHSPHLVLPTVKARLYFGHAVQDRGMPPEAIEKFNAALAVWGGRYESEIYDGAFHSWTVPDSPVYNEAQAERAFGKLTNLLAQQLR
jgi:carboxymethylenebutenolidase